MSSPAVETTGTHPLATRRDLRQLRRERRLWGAVGAAVLLVLLAVAALVVDHENNPAAVSGLRGTTALLAPAGAP
jgi:hypothetical protein